MKPILFNTEMVRAIRDGRKSVTRRLVKPQPGPDAELWYCYAGSHKSDIGKWDDRNGTVETKWTPPCHGDDILYVRETWCENCTNHFLYRAWPGYGQEPEKQDEAMKILGLKWRPSIHMPKEAARLFLRVKRVRVERLQDITADECPMEGVWPLASCKVGERGAYYRNKFAELWDSTIKPADRDTYGWSANPWVWVIKFERISKEEALKGGDTL